jgi:hypothetical protein
LREKALVKENEKLNLKLSETNQVLEKVTRKLKKKDEYLFMSQEIKRNSNNKNDNVNNNTPNRGVGSPSYYLEKTNNEEGMFFNQEQTLNQSLELQQNCNDDNNAGDDSNNILSTSLDLVGKQKVGKEAVLGRYMSIYGEMLLCIEYLPNELQIKFDNEFF